MKYLTFPCGCKFSLVNGDENSVVLDPIIENINLSCSRTWDLISSGNTKGCFQLESRLGRSMSKKLKPSNIEELSALISIMRPGCLEAVRNNKTVSNHFIDKKNGEESIDYFHPSLEPILKNTYGEMVYQEQAMEIVKVIAGFDLQEADMLRKAIGKKKPEEMAKVKIKFLEGCKNINLVDDSCSLEIFNWIEKSQRYSFNKSHAVSYAINAYLSAYTKAHFPQIFFASYLRFAKEKMDAQQEIKELIQNTNEMDVVVCPPDLRLLNENFIIDNKLIYFGLTDIKGLGKSVFDKIISVIEKEKINLRDITWEETLLSLMCNINSTASKGLISSGSLDYFKKTRNSMLFELNLISQLTDRERDIMKQDIKKHKLPSLFKILLKGKINKNRLQIIQELDNNLSNPPFSLTDTPEWISDNEDALLGYPITCSKIDMYDISMTNCNCKDFKNGFAAENILLAGEIDSINVVKTKTGAAKGSDMAFVSLNDSTGSLDSVVCFPQEYKTYKHILFDGNIVIFKGKRSKNKDGLIVEKIFLPSS